MIETATPAADWVVILPVLLCLTGAALLLMLRQVRVAQAGFAVLTVIGVIACEIELLGRVLEGGPVTMTMGKWLPPFGISFAADALGAGFALAAALVTLVVLFYALMDRSGMIGRDGFFSLILLLLGGVTGAFLTGDLFNLYVWFEVLLIASFGLIVLSANEGQVDGAVKYGFLNFIATSVFLLALGLLYGLLGTLNMADIIGKAGEADPAALTGIAALLLVAFATKAAAFPTNAWLPASYHTPPAAVSALFAGLLTKVGVYALLRSLVALLPDAGAFLSPAIALIAIGTLVLAPLGALAETNLRRAIGFLVIGGIGAAIAGMGLLNAQSLAGSAVYVLHSMLSITALYLVAGLIERVTCEADTRRMGGLYAAEPVLAILFLVLVLAVAGVPPFLGFWPKLLLLSGALAGSGAGLEATEIAIAVALLLNAFLTLLAGTRLWAHVFWRAGHEGAMSESPNDRLRRLSVRERWFGIVPAAALVLVVVLAGLWPDLLFRTGTAAARSLVDTRPYIAAFGLAPAAPTPEEVR